ncbi:MAG: ABC transporter permease [Oscillospiraceae bacterium]|nr:ABC transporter permease [Oscillospiraceae bacterium]
MKILKKVYWVFILAFLYMPIFVMIAFSFNQSKSRTVWTGFTLKWYVELFRNEAIIKAFLVTLIVALLAATIATVLGTLAAVGIDAMKNWEKSIVINISYMPVVNPDIITGISLLLLFNVFKQWFDFEFGFGTLLISHITFNVPYVILSVLPKLKQMDYRVYEAALDLGCNPSQAFFKVVVPEIMPGIISGFLMALTFSIDDFIISYFNSGHAQTLPVAIYAMARRRVSPEMYALSTIMFLVILTVLFIVNVRSIKSEKAMRVKKEVK